MCGICGCGDETPGETAAAGVTHTHADGTTHTHAVGAAPGAHTHADGTTHTHADGTTHTHAVAKDEAGDEAAGRRVAIEQAIFAKNDQIAGLNRAFLRGRRVLALNLVSSPGSGKTAILERTIRALDGDIAQCVLEGDQATDHDAERIRAAGARALQINTGAGCHLDAEMVRKGIDALDPDPRSVLVIENVGNLVCPAHFDLGEHCKVVVCSTTEGEDKPIKYPHMFRASSLMLLNKTDLLPHLDFDVEQCVAYARAVNPSLEVIRLSARTGEGFEAWLDWLRARVDGNAGG